MITTFITNETLLSQQLLKVVWWGYSHLKRFLSELFQL